MSGEPHRRWFQFGLRTLLVGMTLTALAVWQVRIVRERRAMRTWLDEKNALVESASQLRHNNGAIYGPLAPGPPELPFWRRWMGDESLLEVVFPYESPATDMASAKAVFPEAEIHARQQPAGYSGGVGVF